MGKLVISVKVPAKVDNLDRALEMLGGPEFIAEQVLKADEKIKKHESTSGPSTLLLKEAKHVLKL